MPEAQDSGGGCLREWGGNCVCGGHGEMVRRGWQKGGIRAFYA